VFGGVKTKQRSYTMKRVTVLLLVLMGITLGYSESQAAEPIYLGLNECRSGPFRMAGDRGVLGMEVAVKEVNQAGGLLGRPVELVIEDNQMKPQIAVTKLKKMILKDKCEAIFSVTSSSVTLAISQAMPRYKKIFLVPATFAMDLTGKYFHPFVFRTCSNAAMMTKSMALYIGKQREEFKKVYMINQDYSWGHDVANLYERFIKEVAPDTQIVGNDFHPMFNKDFGPYISKIKASGADYLLTGNWGPDIIQLLIQSRSLGLNIPFAAILIADPSGLAAMPGDEAVGSLTVTDFFPGFETSEAKKFEDSFYKNSGGNWPFEQTWMIYKSMMMYAEAVRKAGSVDTNKVIQALEGMKWNGPAGTVTMRPKDHQAIQPMIIAQVVKQKTKYFDFPYFKSVQVVPPEQLNYDPEEFGWRPYPEEK
jgi:branched-chain amino acid transport system substrate-binding protein